MADGTSSTNSGFGGNQSAVGGSIKGDNGIIRIDPAAIDAATGTAPPTVGTKPGYGPNGLKLKKDGTERKPKGGGGTHASTSTQAAPPLSVDALTFTLVGIHTALSLTLKIPELAIEPAEGKQMATALQNLQRFYNIQMTEKALAWSNVAMTLVTVYGTRAAAIAARKTAELRNNPRGATVIRPAQFQQPRPTVVTPSSPAAMSPDGDPLQAPPIGGGETPRAPGDAAFATTPAEFI